MKSKWYSYQHNQEFGYLRNDDIFWSRDDKVWTHFYFPGYFVLELRMSFFSITGVIVFVDHRFNVVELSIQPDIIRKAIKKVKKRPKDGHAVKAVCVLKRWVFFAKSLNESYWIK